MSICPLLMISVKDKGIITDADKTWAQCLGNACAWYIHIEREGAKPLDQCAIPQLGRSLIYISKQISARSK
jgi:hypothetical protein